MKKKSDNHLGSHDLVIHPDGAEVWVISSNQELVSRIEPILKCVTERILVFPAKMTDRVIALTAQPAHPRLTILDINDDVNIGARLIKGFKQARIDTQYVIMTRNFSRDFGSKIISKRVHYYFSHDFCDRELLQLVESLLGPKTKKSTNGHDPEQLDGHLSFEQNG